MFEGLFEFLGQNQKDFINISDVHNQINTAQKLIVSLDTKVNEQKDIFYKNLNPLKESLTSLRSNHNLFQDQTSALLDTAKNRNLEFDEATNQSLEILRQKIDGCGTQVSGLNKQSESLNEQISSQFQNFQTGLTEFQSILEITKNEFEARKENLLGKLESIEQDSQKKLQILTETYSSLLDESNNQLSELENFLNTTPSELILDLSRKFEEEILSQLAQSSEEVSQLIEGIGKAGEVSRDLLDGEVGSVLDKLGEVTRSIWHLDTPSKT